MIYYDIWEEPKSGLRNGRFWGLSYSATDLAERDIKSHSSCCRDLILEVREKK